MTVADYIETYMKDNYDQRFPNSMLHNLMYIVGEFEIGTGNIEKSDFIEASKLLYKIYKEYKGTPVKAEEIMDSLKHITSELENIKEKLEK